MVGSGATEQPCSNGEGKGFPEALWWPSGAILEVIGLGGGVQEEGFRRMDSGGGIQEDGLEEGFRFGGDVLDVEFREQDVGQ